MILAKIIIVKIYVTYVIVAHVNIWIVKMLVALIATEGTLLSIVKTTH